MTDRVYSSENAARRIAVASGRGRTPHKRLEEGSNPSTATKYVTIQFTSSDLNPMFKEKPVPYQWTWGALESEAEDLASQARERWPDVTVEVLRDVD